MRHDRLISSRWSAATSMSRSAARRIASISRRTARAFRWSACTPPARTTGNGVICWPTKSSRKDFRIIAFDMPFHGKSNPPAGWSGEEYQLTTARYTETIRAFCKALKLEKPVVMGCSIGGRIVLNLAIDHAARIPRADRARGRRFPGAVVRHGLAQPPRRPWRRSLRRAGLRPDRAAEPASRAATRRCGPTSRAVPASSRATSISTGSTATCAARWRRSILKYARSTCSRASMISPARPKTQGAPHPRYQAPVSPSWRNSAISR